MIELNETLDFLNPWWKSKEVSSELAKPYKRPFLHKMVELQNYRQIVIISGLRRVGKSTILYQQIENLLKNKNEKTILYFNFDKSTEDLIKIFTAYTELTNIDYKKEKISVFFDEITKLPNWARELKLLYDALPNVKFYISSSSSINLEEEAIKNLAGRYFMINVTPLSFREFLELKNEQKLILNKKLYEKELKKKFYLYLLRSFPEIIHWKDERLIRDYIKTTIIDKVIKSDLPERFKNINKELLFTLLELFYKEPGIYLDYDSLSKNLKISKKTLFKHIFYLEFCYLIRIVKNFRPSTLSTSRKLQRAYPYWWNLSYLHEVNKDKLMESFIASVLDLKYYWRESNKEIDFLRVEDRKIDLIEVKNKEKVEEKDLEGMKYFIKKNKVKSRIVVYNGGSNQYNDIRLFSFWDFALLGSDF
jgi:predicted AAA+ superfamily ATPase